MPRGRSPLQQASRDSRFVASRVVPWAVEFFQRHANDDANETVPAQGFLDAVPERFAAKMVAVVQAVAAAPPPAFSGGGMWEAMHDEMAGIYEVRVGRDANLANNKRNFSGAPGWRIFGPASGAHSTRNGPFTNGARAVRRDDAIEQKLHEGEAWRRDDSRRRLRC
jgi:hypothetical protein